MSQQSYSNVPMTDPKETVESSYEDNSKSQFRFTDKRNLMAKDIHNFKTGENTAKQDKLDNAARVTIRSSEPSIIINQPFPNTIDEFKDLRDQYKIDKERPRYYEFTSGETSNKFRISIATVDRLINSREQCLKEVDLSAKQTAPPNSNRNDHQLITALNQNQIEHIVSVHTKNIYVRNCDWSTVCKISNLVAELNCDLTVSGGGQGEYISARYCNVGNVVVARAVKGNINTVHNIIDVGESGLSTKFKGTWTTPSGELSERKEKSFSSSKFAEVEKGKCFMNNFN